VTDPHSLTELYRAAILAHASAPVGRDRRLAATHRAEGDNPLCGDRLAVALEVREGVIGDAAFSGEACSICLASASLLCTHLPGRAVRELGACLERFRAALVAPQDTGICPDFLAPLLAVRAFPARHACATLPWETAAAALASGLSRQPGQPVSP